MAWLQFELNVLLQSLLFSLKVASSFLVFCHLSFVNMAQQVTGNAQTLGAVNQSDGEVLAISVISPLV
jgi:hypothetical protein